MNKIKSVTVNVEKDVSYREMFSSAFKEGNVVQSYSSSTMTSHEPCIVPLQNEKMVMIKICDNLNPLLGLSVATFDPFTMESIYQLATTGGYVKGESIAYLAIEPDGEFDMDILKRVYDHTVLMVLQGVNIVAKVRGDKVSIETTSIGVTKQSPIDYITSLLNDPRGQARTDLWKRSFEKAALLAEAEEGIICFGKDFSEDPLVFVFTTNGANEEGKAIIQDLYDYFRHNGYVKGEAMLLIRLQGTGEQFILEEMVTKLQMWLAVKAIQQRIEEEG